MSDTTYERYYEEDPNIVGHFEFELPFIDNPDEMQTIAVDIERDGTVSVWGEGEFITEFHYNGDLEDHLSIEERVKEVL